MSLRVLCTSLFALGVSCTPQPPRAMSGPSVDQVLGGEGKCHDYHPPTEPDLLGWSTNARELLSTQRGAGAVVVRYSAKGCNVELEVLSNCIAHVRGADKKELGYSYVPYWSKDTKIAHDEDELYTSLPIGAASLSGKMRGGKSLRADMINVGISSLPPWTTVHTEDLEGADCARATHVVGKAYLGAFAMAVGSSQTIEAAASVFGIGAGGSSNDLQSIGKEEGDLSACEAAKKAGKEDPECAVPLRVSLMAIAGKEAVTPTVAGSQAAVTPVATAAPTIVAPTSGSYVVTKESGEGVIIPLGGWASFSVRVMNGGKPVAGARVVWTTPSLGKRAYIGTTGPDGVSSATQLYLSAVPGTFKQVAALAAPSWSGGQWSDDPVPTEGTPVVFQYEQRAALPATTGK